MLIQLGKMDDFFDFCGEITCEWNVVQDALDRAEQLNRVEIILLNENELLSTGIREYISYELSYLIEFFRFQELLDVFNNSVNEDVLILGALISHQINQSFFITADVFQGA
jgi:hypothetical protein